MFMCFRLWMFLKGALSETRLSEPRLKSCWTIPTWKPMPRPRPSWRLPAATSNWPRSCPCCQAWLPTPGSRWLGTFPSKIEHNTTSRITSYLKRCQSSRAIFLLLSKWFHTYLFFQMFMTLILETWHSWFWMTHFWLLVKLIITSIVIKRKCY